MRTATANRPHRAIGFQFVAVPIEIMNRRDLSRTAIMIFSIMLDSARHSPTGATKLTNKQIARRLGVDHSTVKRHLLQLRDAGLIRCEYAAGTSVRLGMVPLWPPVEDNRNQITVDLLPPWTEAAHLPEDERYSMYLCSREWGVRREAIRKRSGGTCERCGSAPMSHVHHLTYKRRYAEPLDDLLGVCEPCHSYVHGRSGRDPKPKAPAVDPCASFSVVA